MNCQGQRDCQTHDLNQGVLQYQALALEGVVAWWGAPRDLLAEGRLEDIYETRFRLVEEPETGTVFIVPGGRIS